MATTTCKPGLARGGHRDETKRESRTPAVSRLAGDGDLVVVAVQRRRSTALSRGARLAPRPEEYGIRLAPPRIDGPACLAARSVPDGELGGHPRRLYRCPPLHS